MADAAQPPPQDEQPASSDSGPRRSIVVLGAGVIGLSVAHALSEDKRNDITIVARDMPEHLDSQGWSSPWAIPFQGANWSPIGTFNERTHKWERATFNKLWSMIPSGLVMPLSARVYHDEPNATSEVWWKDIVRDFRILPSEELPPGATVGLAFTTVSIKPTRYLPWLKKELVSRGIKFIVTRVGSVEEAASYGGDDSVLINASGLGARSLLGIEDLNVHPIRGQTTIVQAPHVKECVSDMTSYNKEPGETTYIIPRPDGSVILGGTFQHDNWDLSIDHKTARRIFERCTAFEPALLPSRGARVISHNVGLRPARRGGPRVEIETIQLPLSNDLVPCQEDDVRKKRELKVIHAYGFGPAGYQNSWGVAEEVVGLLAQL